MYGDALQYNTQPDGADGPLEPEAHLHFHVEERIIKKWRERAVGKEKDKARKNKKTRSR